MAVGSDGMVRAQNPSNTIESRTFGSLFSPEQQLFEEMMTKQRKLRAISLFSGCGGLDLGFHQVGFTIEAAFDINPAAVTSYNHNIEPTARIHDLSSEEPLPYKGKVDVLLAGSPCQGFSVAGKRDLEDPRNSLLLRAGRYALQLQPKIFLAENVPGVLSGGHKTYWTALEELLRGDGYSTTTIKVSALDFGAAQQRNRIFMIGWKSKAPIDLTFTKAPHRSLFDAIGNLSATAHNHDIAPLKKKSADYLISRKIGVGMKLSNVRDGERAVHTWEIPEVFGHTTLPERALLTRMIKLRRQIRVREVGDADPVPLTTLHKEFGPRVDHLVFSLLQKGYLKQVDDCVDLRNTFNGKYRRLAWERPSYTVDTYFGNPRYFLHPTEHRGFSVREAARIQGFPDDFKFLGSEQQNFQMIGNAVSPLVARGLAQVIKDGLLA
ncbi:DNA cytosine methyltransferase [Azospira sp. APE16]|uniref:DNA cytosine methyltransferase n=1 Tax=Azospira sp. APE16 TaxID=3394231 RepID=UPI003A4D320E